MVARDIRGMCEVSIDFDERDLHEIIDKAQAWYDPSHHIDIAHEVDENGCDRFVLHEEPHGFVDEDIYAPFTWSDLTRACLMWALESPEAYARFVRRNGCWVNDGNMDETSAFEIVMYMSYFVL